MKFVEKKSLFLQISMCKKLLQSLNVERRIKITCLLNFDVLKYILFDSIYMSLARKDAIADSHVGAGHHSVMLDFCK